jgi:hypothetical protein
MAGVVTMHSAIYSFGGVKGECTVVYIDLV